MKSAALLATAAATAVTLLAGVEPCLAQDASTPPPPPPPAANGPERPDKPPREGGDKDRDKDKGWHRSDNRGPGGPGGSGYGGGYSRGDRERGGGDMFKGLPEEERQRVREAFEKAWQDPEVIAARDRMSKANEEMRTALHEALKKADPEVVKILEKVRPPGGFPGMARMPDPADPEFAPQAIQRLGGELQVWAKMDRRETDTKPMHDRIAQVPAVKEALQRAQEASPELRPEAWRKLREAYFGAAKAEFVQAWGKSPWDRDRDWGRDREQRGPGGPGGPGFGGDRDRGERPLPPPRPEGEGAPPPPPVPKAPQ
ncbi:hypothetical protein [Roseimicrobium sp. ORNL1]|uniref:hypothetical protein n=1 Tax=Roseimicrobium sp. ORNL1 TaxID=2711231 RepID=UPI0013E1EF38|nr:hypothetical protein [Roseimicrobium sp. ORNL1]QIF03980.1 hypothetical protein G5S37_21420 [Roseimicrobium sp. ORNL1]